MQDYKSSTAEKLYEGLINSFNHSDKTNEEWTNMSIIIDIDSIVDNKIKDIDNPRYKLYGMLTYLYDKNSNLVIKDSKD